MNGLWLVFAAGSAGSFFPILWLLGWLFNRDAKPAVEAGSDEISGSPRTQFLECLRREAMNRAQLAFHEAYALEMGKENPREASESNINARIADLSQTVGVIFSTELASRFNAAIAAILAGRGADGEPDRVLSPDHASGLSKSRLAVAQGAEIA
jgi:hypothetical protein